MSTRGRADSSVWDFDFCHTTVHLQYKPPHHTFVETCLAPDLWDVNLDSWECDRPAPFHNEYVVGTVCRVTCSGGLQPAGGALRACERNSNGILSWTGGNVIRCDPDTGYLRLLTPHFQYESSPAVHMPKQCMKWTPSVTIAAYVRHQQGAFGQNQAYVVSDHLSFFVAPQNYGGQALCISMDGEVRRMMLGRTTTNTA